MRPGQAPPGIRPPPGPPPGVQQPRPPALPRPLGVVTAKPQLTPAAKTDPVIEGAPVMRNLRSDVTRFVPTNLRVKREDTRKQESVKKRPESFTHSYHHQQQQHHQMMARQQQHQQQKKPSKSKDEEYADFMKEMQSFM